MIKNIIFDFDGVILDSVPVKTEGYRQLFKEHPTNLIEKMVEYHELNGGISRYKKVKYFFNELLKEDISEEKIQEYAAKYSELTKVELSKEKYIIQDTLDYIKLNHNKFNMHVASGADHQDLLYICDKLNLNKYFLSIEGSPKVKNEIVGEILNKNAYKAEETILIGDSINDYDAARQNSINFYGYNNLKLKKLVNSEYIYEIEKFDFNS
ncbi:MAG: HAD-IA family hydrolase [Campylobacterota bacterium]|nr:HAD-IA family hydrolase [Campylobacterota bacterium]